MADQPTISFNEYSPERIALILMQHILTFEGKAYDRKEYLDTYAECLDVVRHPQARLPD